MEAWVTQLPLANPPAFTGGALEVDSAAIRVFAADGEIVHVLNYTTGDVVETRHLESTGGDIKALRLAPDDLLPDSVLATYSDGPIVAYTTFCEATEVVFESGFEIFD